MNQKLLVFVAIVVTGFFVTVSTAASCVNYDAWRIRHKNTVGYFRGN